MGSGEDDHRTVKTVYAKPTIVNKTKAYRVGDWNISLECPTID